MSGDSGEWGCLFDPTAPATAPTGKAVQIVVRRPLKSDPVWAHDAAWVVLRDGDAVACVSRGLELFKVFPVPVKEIGRPWRPLVDRMTQGEAVRYARAYAASLED